MGALSAQPASDEELAEIKQVIDDFEKGSQNRMGTADSAPGSRRNDRQKGNRKRS